MIPDAEASDLARRMQAGATRTPEEVDKYYALCIPFYREFLGNHWHTGHYLFDEQPIGPQDQLRMEQRIAESAGLDARCQVLDVGCGIGGPACHLARLTGALATANPNTIVVLETGNPVSMPWRNKVKAIVHLGALVVANRGRRSPRRTKTRELRPRGVRKAHRIGNRQATGGIHFTGRSVDIAVPATVRSIGPVRCPSTTERG